MSGLTEFVGYSGDGLALIFIGWLAGLVTIQWWDNRAHPVEVADDVEREAALLEGRVNQFIGFKRHDFVAARDGEQAAA